jgi:hypothetical protein
MAINKKKAPGWVKYACNEWRNDAKKRFRHGSPRKRALRQELAEKITLPFLSSASTPRKGILRDRQEAQENLTATPFTRATSSPSAATAKTRSYTGTRDEQGFLTQN